MTQRPTEIRLNSFHMHSPGHSWPGLWAHPRDKASTYKNLSFWTHLAKTAERGLFDGIFLADGLGIKDTYEGKPDAALRAAAQIPIHDPALVVPVMASVTRHLGFGITTSVGYESPFTVARRFSTLDHLTEGRVGWNVVTSYLESGARAQGEQKPREHDERYERADEFLEVVYKLWQGSWDDGAVVADKASRIYADPSKVRRIEHHGKFFDVEGIHLCEPSPQRVPVIYQAGASSAGKNFAARHAECIFMNGHSKEVVGRNVADLRRRLVEAGRDPYDLKVFLGATVIVAPTQAEAEDLREEYRGYVDAQGILALFSGRLGVDLSVYAPDEPLRYAKTNAIQSVMEALTKAEPDRAWTINDITAFAGAASRGAFIVGSASQVADELASWKREADVDGFNLTRLVFPESIEAFVDLVVPQLQDRGIYKTAYAEGTLREKLFGQALPKSTHPASRAVHAR